MKTSCVLYIILSVLITVESIPSIRKNQLDYTLEYKVVYKGSVPDENAIDGEETAESPVNHFDGFDRFIDGLSKLQEALNNPDYDWSQMSAAQPDGAPNEGANPSASGDESEASEDPQSSLKDFLVLIDVMKQLTQTQTTTPAPVSQDDLHYLREAEELLKNIISTYSDPVVTNVDLPPAKPENEGQSLDDALNRVSEVFKEVFGNQSHPQNQTQGTVPNEAADILRNSLATLERTRHDYHEAFNSDTHLQRFRDMIAQLRILTKKDATSPAEPDFGLPSAVLNGTCQIDLQCQEADRLSICGEQSRCICPEGYKITEFPGIGLACIAVPLPEPPAIDPKSPCNSPYVDIAYKMCVLPVYEQRLTWNDALQYCRSRGLELAVDAVVVKVRRYFNNDLGEEGSRVRWPLWVGAKKQRNDIGEDQWMWHDGTSVPSFFWPEGNPRSFQPGDAPEGVCMVLDGYQQYNADGLPCHFKRRFVCERPT